MITREYLRNHKDQILVFGDNTLRRGYGGCASLRDENNTYGFITKRYPNNLDTSFYKPNEYSRILDMEMLRLENCIKSNPSRVFLISKVGSGLANRYQIWRLIEPRLRALNSKYPIQTRLLF